MILDRFDGVVFVGDEMLTAVYAAFNMLLRENLVDGALKQWKVEGDTKDACRCDGQFTNDRCKAQVVMTNEDVRHGESDGGLRNPYVCDRKAPTYNPHLQS